MGKQRSNHSGYLKLLEFWSPPSEAGEPVGCIATSFTFSPVFFEEECLSRFLKMETDPDENGSAYLIEREEKLASVKYLGVLIDQHHCKGVRSLRWDMIPFRVTKGILHAKITVLFWSNRLRVIIGSANLTEQGYRTNQEVFTALDFFKGTEVPKSIMLDVLDFLKSLAAKGIVSPEPPEIKRWNDFIENIKVQTRHWGRTEEYRGSSDMRVYPVLIGSGRKSLFAQLKETWQRATGSPPVYAWVTSPFFDPPEASNEPAKKIWELLNQRGVAQAIYNVRVEKINDDHIIIQAPESLLQSKPYGRSDVNVFFEEITERFDSKEVNGFRPLHMKTIWLRNDVWNLYLIGSSNFTSPGTGVGRVINYEANIAFMTSNKDQWKHLRDSSLTGTDLKVDRFNKVNWQTASNEDEPGTDDLTLLPAVFSNVVYFRDEKLKSFLGMQFSSTDLPKGFSVEREDGRGSLYNEELWIKAGKQLQVVLEWGDDLPPSGLNVKWDGTKGYAWWPVNIDNPSSLPPPPELKDLPLEVLIKVLTSARPLHQVLGMWLKKKENSSKEKIDIAIDPHKKVDTTKFLFQRTRQISWVLKSMHEKLQKPFYTEEALTWRLRGPVGILPLINAILKEGQSEDEKAFLVAEIALELNRVVPTADERSLKVDVVQNALNELIRTIRDFNVPALNISDKLIKDYTHKVFRELLK